MEVRCCCQPMKLLGYLPVPPSRAAGDTVTFVIRPVVHCSPFGVAGGECAQVCRAETVALPVARFQSRVGERHLALKSEETPIEVLRRIPGFVERVRA